MADLQGATPSNWGRWGDDDQKGTLNLLTPDTVLAAARLVREGRVVALGRTVDPNDAGTDAVLDNLELRKYAEHPAAGAVLETFTFQFHGVHWTHLDGLAHVWDTPGMWNRRDAGSEVTSGGVPWADVTHPAQGMVGRGLLFDVLSWRNDELLSAETPVTANELQSISRSRSITTQPADMIAIRAGRPEWEVEHGPYGDGDVRPGLDASVLEFMADVDCSVLISDMLDAKPHGLERHWGVHAALYQLGCYLVDNADLTELATTCKELETDQFMMVIAPLAIRGATSSPVSPLAIF